MSCIKPGKIIIDSISRNLYKKKVEIKHSYQKIYIFFLNITFYLDRECPELPQPEQGAVTLSGREFGGKATYTCPIGNNVVGVSIRCRVTTTERMISKD